MSNLNEAWSILHNIKRNTGNPLVNPAFQFALIEYAKPFTKSRDSIKSTHILGANYIPKKYRSLHDEILSARHQLHAHSDITLEEARVYVTNTFYGKHVSVSKNVIYDTEMISKIDDIIDLIEQSLDSMYEEVKRLEAALPINSQ